MKQIIKLTESDLHSIISETLKKILTENNNDKYETWYRGYNSKYGSQRNHLLWITDDISYAKSYGNRVEELIIDTSKLNIASMYDMDDILGYEIDYYDGPNKKETKKIMSQGYNGYCFEANSNTSECLCLFTEEPIVSKRELSKDEFNKIDIYDDLDYKEYDEDYD